MPDFAALAAIPSAQNSLAEQQAKLRIQQQQAQQLALANAAQQQQVDQQTRMTKGASALGGSGSLAAAFGQPIPGGAPQPQAAPPQQGGMPSMIGAQGGGGPVTGPAGPPPSTPGMGLKPDNPAASMPPAVALVYQDTAETIGPGVAQHILQESQGDVAKMLQMRQAHYENVAKANPDIAQQLPALTAKNEQLAQRVAQLAQQGQGPPAAAPQQPADPGAAAADPQLPMRLLMQTVDFVKQQYAQNNPGEQLDGETALELAGKIASTSKLFTPEQRIRVQQAVAQTKAASAESVADTRAQAQRDVAGTNAGSRERVAGTNATSRETVANTNAAARISSSQISAQARTAAAGIASGGRVTSAQIAAAAKDKATEFGGETAMWRAKIAAAVQDRRTKANGLKDPGAASPDPAKPSMPGKAASAYKSADDVKAAFHAGKLNQAQAQAILKSDFGFE